MPMQVAAEEELGRGIRRRLLKWVWGYVRPYRRLFWLSVLLMPLNSIFALAAALRHQATIDIFLAAHTVRTAALARAVFSSLARPWDDVMGAIYVILLLGEFASFYGQFYLTMMVAQYSLSDLRLALFQPCRAAADGVFRPHAGRPPGQPDDHRYRRHQRNVQRRFVDPVHRSADARPASS